MHWHVQLRLDFLALGHALVKDHVVEPYLVLLGEPPWVVTMHLHQVPLHGVASCHSQGLDQILAHDPVQDLACDLVHLGPLAFVLVLGHVPYLAWVLALDPYVALWLEEVHGVQNLQSGQVGE